MRSGSRSGSSPAAPIAVTKPSTGRRVCRRTMDTTPPLLTQVTLATLNAGNLKTRRRQLPSRAQSPTGVPCMVDNALTAQRAQRLPLYIGGMMGPFGTIVILPMFPELRESFNASSATVSWGFTIYLLPFAAVLLVSGTLGERWGRRRTVRGPTCCSPRRRSLAHSLRTCGSSSPLGQ